MACSWQPGMIEHRPAKLPLLIRPDKNDILTFGLSDLVAPPIIGGEALCASGDFTCSFQRSVLVQDGKGQDN